MGPKYIPQNMPYNLFNPVYLNKNIHLETHVLLKLIDKISLYMNQTVETFTLQRC